MAITIHTRLRDCAVGGLRKGLRTGWWMTKMMLPITLGMALLKYFGVIDWLSELLSPAFSLIGLTADGVLVFITACLSSLYSAIAVIATLEIDFRAATILAVMGLICHNLVVETIIQKKAGASATFIVVLRIAAALLAAFALNWILPTDFAGRIVVERMAAPDGTFGGALTDWGWSMAKLLPMMFALIVGLNILQGVLREFRLIDYLIMPLAPLMRILGLSLGSSFLWVVLNTLGLAYGGAVLIAEVEGGGSNQGCPGSNCIDSREARLLNTHAALNHSLLEDTLLFAAIGVGVVWLVIPRVLLAIAAVWGQRLYYKLRSTGGAAPAHANLTSHVPSHTEL